MAEPVDAWWARRQRSKGSAVPYPVGSFRSDWERYPVLIRQYHPDLNGGITLTQIPPAAEVYLQWQCEVGHVFVATPTEQRGRPGGQRRRSVWCPDCAEQASPTRVKPAREQPPWERAPEARPSAERPSATRRRTRTAVSVVRKGAPQPGEAFWSPTAPKPASAAEADLRQRLRDRFDFELTSNAIAVAQPFFGRFEVWPDIILPELRVAIEYDTVGRHGLEHVGPREQTDRRKDRLLRAVGWEVIRVRCGKLLPLGDFDLVAGGVTNTLVRRIDDTLAALRGDLLVSAYRRSAAPPGGLEFDQSAVSSAEGRSEL